MAHTILATAMKSMSWLRGAVDASAYVSSLPSEGTISAKDPLGLNLILSLPLIPPTANAIWETKTLTIGIVLGIVIIFIVNYIRSPWRKLPPSPRRLPVLGNALQLRDKSWLLSKDCKERFGEFSD
jgi:hypothetical protein